MSRDQIGYSMPLADGGTKHSRCSRRPLCNLHHPQHQRLCDIRCAFRAAAVCMHTKLSLADHTTCLANFLRRSLLAGLDFAEMDGKKMFSGPMQVGSGKATNLKYPAPSRPLARPSDTILRAYRPVAQTAHWRKRLATGTKSSSLCSSLGTTAGCLWCKRMRRPSRLCSKSSSRPTTRSVRQASVLAYSSSLSTGQSHYPYESFFTPIRPACSTFP